MESGACPIIGVCGKPCPSETSCLTVSVQGGACGRLWVQKTGQPRHNLPMPCVLAHGHGGDVHRDPVGREWPVA